jgi:hypothetical protein
LPPQGGLPSLQAPPVPLHLVKKVDGEVA